jgi:sugar fermentation stimulation protein A
VLFLIQMDGVRYFTPYDEMDKPFGDALREAHEYGVDVFAYDCTVGEDFITLKSRVDVRL